MSQEHDDVANASSAELPLANELSNTDQPTATGTETRPPAHDHDRRGWKRVCATTAVVSLIAAIGFGVAWLNYISWAGYVSLSAVALAIWAVLAWRKGPEDRRELFITFVSLLIAPLVLTILGKAIDERQRPPVKIALIGPQSGNAASVWADVNVGMQAVLHDYTNSNPSSPPVSSFEVGKNHVIVVPVDDRGKNEWASDEAKKLFTDGSYIAAVGHVESSVMESALPNYANWAKTSPVKRLVDALPIITPACTADVITKFNDQDPSEKNRLDTSDADASRRYVFQIPPRNSEQAVIAAEFIKYLFPAGHAKIAIIRDSSNPSYSNGLADSLRSLLDDPAVASGRPPDHVVFDGSNSSSGTGDLMSRSIAALRPDLIFFAGMDRNAIPLVWQTRSMGGAPSKIGQQVRAFGTEPQHIIGRAQMPPSYERSAGAGRLTNAGLRAPGFRTRVISDRNVWAPVILLTDGCVTGYFQSAADAETGDVYATFPLPGSKNGQTSYSSFGRDAMQLLLAVLRDLDDRGKPLTRQNIRELMGTRNAQPGDPEGTFRRVNVLSGKNGECLYFDEQGGRVGLSCHILKLAPYVEQVAVGSKSLKVKRWRFGNWEPICSLFHRRSPVEPSVRK